MDKSDSASSISESSMSPSRPVTDSRKRRRRGALLILLILLVAVIVCRHQLLRAVAGFLIVEDQIQAADYALVEDGLWAIEDAAALYKAGSIKRILVQEQRPTRLEKGGIVPAAHKTRIDALVKRGIVSEDIEILEWKDGKGWDDLRRLSIWLVQRPTTNVIVLIGRFSSRDFRYRLHAVAPESVKPRVRFRAVPDPRYDETNWWQSKEGKIRLFDEYVGYAFDVLHGEETESWQEADLTPYKPSVNSGQQPKNPSVSASGKVSADSP